MRIMMSTTREINSCYRALLRASEAFLRTGDIKRIRGALNFAIANCGETATITGENSVIHSLSVARIVAGEMNLGTTPVIAAILYESSAAVTVSKADLNQIAGLQVAGILEGLRKIGSIETHQSARQSEEFRRLILSLADDVRVIAIKLASRLHEMRQLGGLAEEKRVSIASETYFLYAPLAYRLGFYNIKSEMEDLAMKHLEPESYNQIECRLKQTTSSRNRLIRDFVSPLREKLDQLELNYTIKSRTKSVHSIWQKMKKQGVEFDEVYDIFAIRIIIDAPQDREKALCWQAYSVVTDTWQPNPSRMRDWISVPKSSGYESLHTTVVGPRGKWVEVQIRSVRMDEVAEKGLAAHYLYKGLKGEKGGLEGWLVRMRELLESSASEDDRFLSQVRPGLWSDEVFVFTPKGELRRLPAGATVLDFAFDIHTEVGAKCVGARVNGRNVTFRHVLNNGDQVSVLTSKNQKPKGEWLTFVVTGKARTRIKQALNEDRVAAAAEGREILERRLKNWKIGFSDSLINRLLIIYNCRNAQDLYVRISTEDIDLLELKEHISSGDPDDQKTQPDKQPQPERKTAPVREQTYSDYLIIDERIEGIDYRLAKCCNPVYGDPVFGFVTISEGIKIHRAACPNAGYMIARYPYRVVPARWTESKQSPSFVTVIKVSGVEDIGIVSKISDILSQHSITVRGFSYSMNDGIFDGTINLTVPNVNILNGLIRRIQSVKGVSRAMRHDQQS